MAGDDLKKLSTGQKFAAVPARAWNAFIDAANDYKKRTANIGKQDKGPDTKNGMVYVRNDTGGDLDQFSVVGLNDLEIGPDDNLLEFKRVRVFSGVTPEHGEGTFHGGLFAVLAEPLAIGKLGMAYVEGIVCVRLYVFDETYECPNADIDPGYTDWLNAAAHGSATIIWREGGTGDQWAVVRLGRLPKTFPVDLVQTGGTAGGPFNQASWTYEVYDYFTGEMILALADPIAAPHEWRRPNVGAMLPADSGYATYDAVGNLILGWINEAPDNSAGKQYRAVVVDATDPTKPIVQEISYGTSPESPFPADQLGGYQTAINPTGMVPYDGQEVWVSGDADGNTVIVDKPSCADCICPVVTLDGLMDHNHINYTPPPPSTQEYKGDIFRVGGANVDDGIAEYDTYEHRARMRLVVPDVWAGRTVSVAAYIHVGTKTIDHYDDFGDTTIEVGILNTPLGETIPEDEAGWRGLAAFSQSLEIHQSAFKVGNGHKVIFLDVVVGADGVIEIGIVWSGPPASWGGVTDTDRIEFSAESTALVFANDCNSGFAKMLGDDDDPEIEGDPLLDYIPVGDGDRFGVLAASDIVGNYAPALVNPSVVDNFVAFSDIAGAQKDSGSSAASFALSGHNHAGVYLPVAGAGDIYTHNAAEFAPTGHTHAGVYQPSNTNLSTIAALADGVGALTNDGAGNFSYAVGGTVALLNAANVFDIGQTITTGKLTLSATGSDGGLSCGTATACTLYQSASDTWYSPNTVQIAKNLLLGGANTYTYISLQHNSATAKSYMQNTSDTGFSLNSNAYFGGATWARTDTAKGAAVLQCNGDGTTYNFWYRWGAAGANPLTLTSLMHLDSTGLLSLDVSGSDGGISCGTATACTLYQSASDTWYTPNNLNMASGKFFTALTDGITGGVKLGSTGDVLLYRGAASNAYCNADFTSYKAIPEHRLTDTVDSEYSRWYRTSVNKKTFIRNRVNVPAVLGTGAMAASTYYGVATLSGTALTTVSVEFWFRLDTNTALIGLFQWTSVSAYSSPWILLQKNATTTVRWYVDGNFRMTHAGLSQGIWYHVVLTYDGTTWRSRINDGNAQSYVGAIGAAQQLNATKVWFSNGYNVIGESSFDEARIYSNRVLSLAEITSHYNSGYGWYGTIPDTSLAAGWHFDDATGLNATDYSGNGKTVAYTGGLTWPTGIVSALGTTQETTIATSENGFNAGEYGIQTYGHSSGRTVLDGTTLRFNVAGIEYGRLEASGNLALFTAAGGSYGGMLGGMFMGNVGTEPATNPILGMCYYSNAGGPKWRTSSGEFLIFTAAGALSSSKSIVATTGFGCNGAAAQTAYATGGAMAGYVTGAFGFDSDAHASELHAMVVKIRAALVANGIMS